MSVETDSATRKPQRIPLRYIVAALTVAVCIFLSLIYIFRPDPFAAVTVWPVWAWSFIATLILLFCLRRRNNRPILAASAVWLLYLLVLSEEPRSLVRFSHLDSQDWIQAHEKGHGLRVVLLNCAGGSVTAMREVAAYHPDVVLLQESPPAKDVEAFSHSLFPNGAGVWAGVDASLIVDGTIEKVNLPRNLSSYFVEARAKLKNGVTLEVLSTRLTPAVFREDLWSPSCWQEHAANRRFRRDQMRELAASIQKVPENVPVLLAGDFNAPQSDAVFDLLRPRLADAYKMAGSGWGNTITNEMPVLRIDQIWASRQLIPVAVVSRRTQESDHRMVIADFILRDESAR